MYKVIGRLGLICSLLALLGGCSLLKRGKMISKNRTISSEQYSKLEEHYNALKAAQAESASSNKVSAEDDPKPDNKAGGGAKLGQTVDVFSTNHHPRVHGATDWTNDNRDKKTADADVDAGVVRESVSDQQIMDEIKTYRMAKGHFEKKDGKAAMAELKKIENSKAPHIRAHAKFLMGEIFFALEQECDLAMQMYEEIITQDAFSGVVIKALGKLIVCSEQLGLDDKRQQYYSMLRNLLDS